MWETYILSFTHRTSYLQYLSMWHTENIFNFEDINAFILQTSTTELLAQDVLNCQLFLSKAPRWVLRVFGFSVELEWCSWARRKGDAQIGKMTQLWHCTSCGSPAPVWGVLHWLPPCTPVDPLGHDCSRVCAELGALSAALWTSQNECAVLWRHRLSLVSRWYRYRYMPHSMCC